MVSKTYDIIDAWKYNSFVENSNGLTGKNNPVLTYSSDGVLIGGNNRWKYLYVTEHIPKECIIEFTFTGYISSQSWGNIGFTIGESINVDGSNEIMSAWHEKGNNDWKYYLKNTSPMYFSNQSEPALNSKIKIELTSTNIKFYINDTLIGTVANNNSTINPYFAFMTYYTLRVKDLIIKQL